jgi:hypothetical protein
LNELQIRNCDSHHSNHHDGCCSPHWIFPDIVWGNTDGWLWRHRNYADNVSQLTLDINKLHHIKMIEIK